MAVGDGQDIGIAQRLTDVALALHFAHPQRIAADPVGALGRAAAFSHLCSLMISMRFDQWISIPPFTSSVTPVR